MDENPLNLEEIVGILERTPGSLTALLVGLPDTWVTATEVRGALYGAFHHSSRRPVPSECLTALMDESCLDQIKVERVNTG